MSSLWGFSSVHSFMNRRLSLLSQPAQSCIRCRIFREEEDLNTELTLQPGPIRLFIFDWWGSSYQMNVCEHKDNIPCMHTHAHIRSSAQPASFTWCGKRRDVVSGSNFRDEGPLVLQTPSGCRLSVLFYSLIKSPLQCHSNNNTVCKMCHTFLYLNKKTCQSCFPLINKFYWLNTSRCTQKTLHTVLWPLTFTRPLH